MNTRFYIVDDHPTTTAGRLILGDGSALICVTEDRAAAFVAISNNNRLSLRQPSDMSREDRRKVREAL
jgi:hypothetical protein